MASDAPTYPPATRQIKVDKLVATQCAFGAIDATPISQRSHVADPVGMVTPTASDPAANASATQGTYTASTTLTDPPTKAEMEAELALIDAELDKVKVDIAAGKTATDANNTAIDALIVDVAALKTALDAQNTVTDSILATLEAYGFHATS